MGWPQVAVIGLMVMSFTVHAIKHGEPKGTWNVLGAILSIVVWAGLLYAGGFFG